MQSLLLVVVLLLVACRTEGQEGEQQDQQQQDQPPPDLATIGGGKQPRPEFKHSLKGPFYMVRSASIPFWDFGGSAAVTEEFVRLTQAAKSKKGYLWNKRKSMMTAWEVVIDFRVSGGGRQGADGFAFWYAEDAKVEGSAFGSKETWKGLGVFFDTYDNDGLRDNPSIYASVNDGTWKFNNDKDGEDEHKLGSCKRMYRNSQKPNRVRIKYLNGLLAVETDLLRNGEYSECFSAKVDLPQNYYFGLTAETGFYFDNHDIYSIQTSDLNPLSYAEIIEQMKQRNADQQQLGTAGAGTTTTATSSTSDDSNSNSNNAKQEEAPARASTTTTATTKATTSSLDSMLDNINDRLRQLEKKNSDRDVEYERISTQIQNILHSHEQALEKLKQDAANQNGNDNDSNKQDPLTAELSEWLQRVDDAVRVAQNDITELQQLQIAEDMKSLVGNVEEVRTELRTFRDTIQQQVTSAVNGVTNRNYVEHKDLDKLTTNVNVPVTVIRNDLANFKKQMTDKVEANPIMPMVALGLSVVSILVALYAMKMSRDEKKKYSFS